MDDKYKIINYLNYRVTKPSVDDLNILLRANYIAKGSETGLFKVSDLDVDITSEKAISALLKMYGINPDYINIPFYMLNQKELAFAGSVSKYAFVFNEEEKRLFADLNEMLFQNDELAYEFLHNNYLALKDQLTDFRFTVSCDRNIETIQDKAFREEYEYAKKREKEGRADEYCKKIINDYEKWLKDGKAEEEYKGRYPKLNALWSKVYKCRAINDFKDKLSDMKPSDFTELMEFFNGISLLQKWSEYKKVYTLSNDLFDDFYAHYKEKSDIEIPLSVLDNLPFDTFYINLRNNRLNFSPQVKTEGMLIHALRDGENKLLGFNIFVPTLVENGYYHYVELLFDLDNYCDLTKDNMIIFNKEKVNESVKRTKINENKDVLNDSDIKRTINYHTKLFYIALQSVFYLCCTNKKMDKHYVALNSHSRGERGEENIEDITIGFVYTNELRNQIKESEKEETNEETVFVNNTGRGTHRPHLVRGHFHHYHTKDGLILKYLEPYFTGVGKDFITHTIVKAPKEMQTFSKKDADIDIKGNNGQVKA